MNDDQYYLHRDIEERHWWFVGRRMIMRRLLARVLPPAKESLVIDVGCGTGANLAFLEGAYSCLGIDDNRLAIALARSRFGRLEFLCGVAPDDVGERWQQARAILLMDVLEHVEDDFLFFSKLLAGLSPGAHVLVTVPAMPSLWSPHDEAFGHYRRYDIPRLTKLWEDLPVTAPLVSFFMARLYPAVKLVRTLSRWRGQSWGRAATDFRLPREPWNRLLTRLLAGESRRLERALDRPQPHGYRRGVSLLALLRREPGAMLPRSKPAGLPPDTGPSPR